MKSNRKRYNRQMGYLAFLNSMLDTVTINIHINDDAILRYSAECGQLAVVEFLLHQGYHLHAKTNASTNGYLTIVELLLAHGADLHVDNEYALRSASANGELTVVKLLLDREADVHANYDEALRLAATRGHHAVVELLLNHGANVNDDALICAATTSPP